MLFGTQFKQGDVLIVPFPFSNLRTVRQRPVLVLSNNFYNKNSEDVIVCGITSNLKESEYSVSFDNSFLSQGKILVASKIKVDKLFTIEKEIVRKKIATVNEEILNRVKVEFNKLVK